MAVDIVTEIIIRRPREEVAAYVSNPNNLRHWCLDIKAVEWKSMPPLRVASKLAFHALFLGRQISYTYEVVELVPGEWLVLRTVEGPFAMETAYTWESVTDGSTRMTMRNRGTPTGFSKLFTPFTATSMRKANNKDLALLKSILEST